MSRNVEILLKQAAEAETAGNRDLAELLLGRALDLEAFEASRQVVGFRQERNGNLVAIYA